MYKITPYSVARARELNLIIRLSQSKKYKIDIFNLNGDYITSGGASGYSDYPTYINSRGLNYANERRRLYRIRHRKEIENVGSRGWLINHILW